jgi:hypothetical protein
MSWGAQNRSKDANTPSVAGVRLIKPEPDCCPVQPYGGFKGISKASAHCQCICGGTPMLATLMTEERENGEHVLSRMPLHVISIPPRRWPSRSPAYQLAVVVLEMGRSAAHRSSGPCCAVGRPCRVPSLRVASPPLVHSRTTASAICTSFWGTSGGPGASSERKEGRRGI